MRAVKKLSLIVLALGLGAAVEGVAAPRLAARARQVDQGLTRRIDHVAGDDGGAPRLLQVEGADAILDRQVVSAGLIQGAPLSGYYCPQMTMLLNPSWPICRWGVQVQPSK